MFSKSILALLLCCELQRSESQFLYPVDPNPPQNPLTFECHVCQSGNDPNCGRNQNETSNTETCTGIRIGCWITLDLEANEYTRTCIQPPSIRQGVFCNRLMEGKEFCFVLNQAGRNIIMCSMCCLSDRCNSVILKGTHDRTLQTCINCNGKNDQRCNSVLGKNNSAALTEQCLMPNSDCWTAKEHEDGEAHYIRGCQIQQCNDENMEENCNSNENGGTTCVQCCRGDQCNNQNSSGSDGFLIGSVQRYFLLFSLNIAAISVSIY